MLISIEVSRNSAFFSSDKPRMLFFLLINVYEQEKFHAQLSEYEIFFYNLGARIRGMRDNC